MEVNQLPPCLIWFTTRKESRRCCTQRRFDAENKRNFCCPHKSSWIHWFCSLWPSFCAALLTLLFLDVTGKSNAIFLTFFAEQYQLFRFLLSSINNIIPENFLDICLPQIWDSCTCNFMGWHEDLTSFVSHPAGCRTAGGHQLKFLPAAVQMEHRPQCFHWSCLHFSSLNKLQHHTVTVTNWHNKWDKMQWYFSPTQLYW